MQVTLDNEKVLNIEKLPLEKYADLLGAFQELPKHLNEFKDFQSLTTTDFIQLLPKLVANCLPDLIRIAEIGASLTHEEVQALGPHEFIDVLTAIFTVNNYQKVYERLKKLLPQPKQIQENSTQTN